MLILDIFGLARQLNIVEPKILMVVPAIDQEIIKKVTHAGVYHLFGMSMLRFFHLFVKTPVNEAKKSSNTSLLTQEFMNIFIPYGGVEGAFSAEIMIEALTEQIKKK